MRVKEKIIIKHTLPKCVMISFKRNCTYNYVDDQDILQIVTEVGYLISSVYKQTCAPLPPTHTQQNKNK